MSGLQLRLAKLPGDVNKFLKLQHIIYKRDPLFVPPLRIERKEFLNPSRNPFFKHSDLEFFLAYKDGKICGSISAFIDHDYVKFHNEKVVHFGFFECINDREVAKALFDKVEEFAKKRNYNVIRGPYNFSTNHECGLLVDGWNGPPVFLMTYNPPYYKELIEARGYTKTMDLLAYYLEAKPVPEALKSVAENVIKTNKLRVRKANMKNFEREIEVLKEIYNDAWSRNWGFVPLSDEEFDFIAKDLKLVVDPDFVYIVEKDGEPAGFSLSLPDFNQVLIKLKGRLLPFGILKLLIYKRKINFLRIFALGIKKKFQDLGIGAILYYNTWKTAIEKGYKGGEMSWILENNKPMRRAIEMAGAYVYRTYRIYEKKI